MSENRSLYGISDEPDQRQRDLAVALNTTSPLFLGIDRANSRDCTVEIEWERRKDGSLAVTKFTMHPEIKP